jgi:hypothetical protein
MRNSGNKDIEGAIIAQDGSSINQGYLIIIC